MRPLTPARSTRARRHDRVQDFPFQVASPSIRPVSNHRCVSLRRFLTLPLSAWASARSTRARSGLRLCLAGSPLTTAETSSLHYGPNVHLHLLPTPHRCGAVDFGYGPESVCPAGTCTPRVTRPHGRTKPAKQACQAFGAPGFSPGGTSGTGPSTTLHSAM